MPANYVLLEKITVGAAGSSSVTFNSIPQSGYTDIVVKASLRTNNAAVAEALLMSFNGSTTSFSEIYLYGSGSAASSGTSPARYTGEAVGNSATANTFSNVEIYIPNYLSSNYKSFSVDSVTENNATAAGADLIAGLWSVTTAINQITISPNVATAFLQYSTFSLYGVAALGTTPAIAPYATGGDIIMSNGTYWYHAFLSSGTFTPAKGLTCEVLTVAGGAGGGGVYGGGGGAGGVRNVSGLSISTAQTVTVGAGGTGVSGAYGTSGNDSIFSTVTSTGGGAGAAGGGVNAGTNGGSGGGGTVGGAGGSGNTPSTSPSQGNNGGSGAAAVNYGAGGGGGSGAVGTNGTTTVGGNGGAGVNTYSTWLSAVGQGGVSGFLAGGGGGGTFIGGTIGTGGSGGGGAAGAAGGNNNGIAATANTGSGGGGGSYQSAATAAGGAGGSGIVIVRYLI